MRENEFETVEFRKIKHINVLFNRIIYRSFHIHSELELLCVLRGSCRVNVRGHIIGAETGSVILVNHSEAHEIQSAEGADMIIIQLSNHTLREYFPQIRTTFFEKAELTEGLGETERRRLWGLIYSLAKEYTEALPLFELRCVSLVAELLEFLYEKIPHSVYSEQKYLSQKKVTGRIDRIVSYIRNNYNGDISLTAIAGEEGITHTHLSHFFREQLGVTFQEYVGNLRFEHALRLMGNSQLSLYEIALQSGFSDVKYMAKMFRDRFGCTPREYTRFASEQAPGRRDNLTESRYDAKDSLALLETAAGAFFPDCREFAVRSQRK